MMAEQAEDDADRRQDPGPGDAEALAEQEPEAERRDDQGRDASR